MAGKYFDEFTNETYGKAFDFDGLYGAQCVEGYQKYCKWLGMAYYSGNAKNIWKGTSKGHPGCTAYGSTSFKSRKVGDIVIFGATADNDYGHIAMIASGDRLYGQNQGSFPDGKGGGGFCYINILGASVGQFLGGYRPTSTYLAGAEKPKGRAYNLVVQNGFVIKVTEAS
jgi:hypothetical protein